MASYIHVNDEDKTLTVSDWNVPLSKLFFAGARAEILAGNFGYTDYAIFIKKGSNTVKIGHIKIKHELPHPGMV